jgi:chlorite dismutase
MYAVLRAETRLPEDTTALAEEVQAALDEAFHEDGYTRGTYDISGFEGDAELLIWWACRSVDVLQDSFSLSLTLARAVD